MDELLDNEYDDLKEIFIDEENSLSIKVRKEDWVNFLFQTERRRSFIILFIWVLSFLATNIPIKTVQAMVGIFILLFSFIGMPFLFYFNYKKHKTLQRLYLYDLELEHDMINRYEYSEMSRFRYDKVKLMKEVDFGLILSEKYSTAWPYLRRVYFGHFFDKDYIVVPKSIKSYRQIKIYLEGKIDVS